MSKPRTENPEPALGDTVALCSLVFLAVVPIIRTRFALSRLDPHRSLSGRSSTCQRLTERKITTDLDHNVLSNGLPVQSETTEEGVVADDVDRSRNAAGKRMN